MGGTLKPEDDYSKYLKLQPLKDIHLKSHLRWELESNGDIMNVYIFASAAILVLFIACINFMNLATARSLQRAKEVGVRKTIGANRGQLVYQFMFESLMLSIFAASIAVMLVELIFPWFNNFTGKNISFSILRNPAHFISLLVLTLVVAFFAGSYPALFLSSFKPIHVLKGKFAVSPSSGAVRKGLVIFQFSISIFLITATITTFSQMNFIHNKNLGFDRDQVIAVPLRSAKAQSNYETFKNTILQNPLVVGASGVSNIPGSQFNQEMIRWRLEDDPVNVSEMRIDKDFFKTLNIHVDEGRSFSKEFGMDTMNVFMINKAAANSFTWKAAVGEDIYYYPQDRTVKGKVIGVVNDFHYRSLQESIQPLLIMYDNRNMGNLLIRLKANHVQEGINFVEQQWKSFSPGDSFEYEFLDEYIGKAYSGEERAKKLFEIFSLLAISIACLGLYGLAAFTTGRRVKEIGVRKVMGASSVNIIMLLTKDFSKWVLLANIIAWPAAYFIMKKWLEEFAYRIDLSVWFFIFSGILALSIALLTVGYQAIKAALANPVDSLKYE
jgi:putative ABC transport system permease protein